MRRTKSEAAETREAIIDAAQQSFLEHGVSHTTLNMIALRAGVTRGAIYFHFHDKIDIFHAIIERIRFPQEEMIDEVLANNNLNPLDVMQKAACASFERFANDTQQQQVITIITQKCEYVGAFANMLTRLHEAQDSMCNLFSRMFALAKTRNMLSDKWQPENAARAMIALVGGLINDWISRDKDFVLQEIGPQALEALFISFREHK